MTAAHRPARTPCPRRSTIALDRPVAAPGEPMRTRRREATRGRPLALVVALLVAGCGLANAAPGGQLTATGPTLGEWTLTPDTCLSGQRRDFLGVTLLADAQPGIRVDIVDDPLAGLGVAVRVDGRCDDRTACPPVTVKASGCTALDGEVVRDLSRLTNNLWHVGGWMTINCAVEGGGRLEGEVSFSACH
ncbi:MAG: hypothetical protein R3B09_19425 [Nannocystaceae bacterium]